MTMVPSSKTNIARSMAGEDSNLRIASFSCYLNTSEQGSKLNLRPVTPSVSSEVSSWNSQTAFIQTLQRNPSQSKQKRSFGKRSLLNFGCIGPCSEKKDVFIKESFEHILKRGEPFAFPIAGSGMENLTIEKLFDEGKMQEDPRKSLEVFGSTMKMKGDITSNLERKLSMLTWDAIPKSQSHVMTTLGSSTICDDMASDASSDLFEIENISGTGYAMLTRQVSDNMSSCMTPTTQYAPSEASIQWSVITASAEDFSSVVSGYDEENTSIAAYMTSKSATNKTAKIKNMEGKEARKVRPSRLLGCGSHKAVSVAESTYKTSLKENH